MQFQFLCPCGERATKMCGRCRVARYCSRKCQKEDYAGHEDECKACELAPLDNTHPLASYLLTLHSINTFLGSLELDVNISNSPRMVIGIVSMRDVSEGVWITYGGVLVRLIVDHVEMTRGPAGIASVIRRFAVPALLLDTSVSRKDARWLTALLATPAPEVDCFILSGTVPARASYTVCRICLAEECRCLEGAQSKLRKVSNLESVLAVPYRYLYLVEEALRGAYAEQIGTAKLTWSFIGANDVLMARFTYPTKPVEDPTVAVLSALCDDVVTVQTYRVESAPFFQAKLDPALLVAMVGGLLPHLGKLRLYYYLDHGLSLSYDDLCRLITEPF